MNKKLPLDQSHITITEAAQILGVTKRTLQRWVKSGKLHAIRPSGKECYFTVEEIEKHRQNDLLSVEEAANMLGVSIEEFLEFSGKGLINRVASNDGQFGYTKESVEQLLHTLFYMQQKSKDEQPEQAAEKEKKEPVVIEKASEVVVHNSVEQKVMSTDGYYLHNLRMFHRIVIVGSIILTLTFAVIVFVITLFFLIVPEDTAEFFGYQYQLSLPKLAKQQVLGTQISAEEAQEQHILGTLLKPFSKVALILVKKIDSETHKKIVPEKTIRDVNDILKIDEKGNIVPKTSVKFPDETYLVTAEGELVERLKEELRSYVLALDQEREVVTVERETPSPLTTPSTASLNVLTSQITSAELAYGAVVTDSIADGAVTSVKLASGVGVLGDNAVSSSSIKNGEVKDEDIADGSIGTAKIANNAVTDNKLAQITTSEKVAGSAVQLSASGGLTNNSGLSLLQTCTDGQVLAWNAISAEWECNSVAGGGGDITSVSAGTGLTGGGATGAVTLHAILGDTVDLTSEVTGILPVANGGTGTTTLNDLISLGTHTTGNYVSSVTAGSGISVGGSAGEAWAPSIALGSLTGDWNQNAAFDIVLGHASSEFRMVESVGGTYYGTFDVGDLGSDQVYTFGIGGTVYTSGNDPFDTAAEIQAVSTGGDVSGAISNIQIATGAVGTNEAAGLDISSDTNLSASDGISLTGDALTNTDKGSSQNIFKTVAVSGQNNVVSDTNADTLTLVAGSNITITTDDTTDSITINASGGGSYTAGNDLDLTGSQFDLESVIDTVSTINLAGTGTLNGLDAIDATTETTIETAIDTLNNLTAASSLSSVGTLTSGSTGAGFTLNFGTSTLSGNVTGSNIDESSLSGLGTSNFTSANVSQWTNDAGYITDGNTNWNNSYGFITASSTDTLTNKSGNISQWTNDSGYLTSVDVSGNTNLSASNGVSLTGDALSLDVTYNPTWTNLHTFTRSGTAILIKPGSAPAANTKLFDVQQTGAGTTVFSIDYEGDLSANSLSLVTGLTDANVSDTLTIGASGSVDAAALSGTVASGRLSGTYAIDVSGNAATVTNGVYTSGSYADPGWITSLAGSKVSGNISGNAANVTGSVGDANVSDALTISGGTINNSVIGGSTPAAATVTDLTANGNAVLGDGTGNDSITLRKNGSGNVTFTGFASCTSLETDGSGNLTCGTDDGGTSYSAGNDLDLTGSTFDIESTLDSVSTINFSGTGTINGLDAIDATTESTLEAAIDALSNLTTVGTLTSGSTGAGFTLNFGTSTLSGNVGGGNIDESSLAGLTVSNFTSANISQWTNNSGYITDGNTNWDNSYNFITASSSDALTNKTGDISMWTNDSGYITDGNTGWNNSYGFITASSTDTLTNKSGNISQWTNDSGYLTSVSNGNLGNDTIDLDKVADSLTLDNNLTYVSNNATNDYKLVIDNASTGDVAELLEFTTSGVGGTVATAIDLSDADIATAIALGANDIVVGGVTIDSTEFARLNGLDAALVDINDGVATAITGTGTLTAGATGAGFTLNFGTSTLSGNVGGGNIDESSLAGLGTSNFTSANISQWTNNSGYLSTVDISSNTNLSASDGISLTGDALTNTDKGSSQNIFKTIAVSGQNNVVTDANGDTLTLVAGSNITITTDDTTDSITIAASGGGSYTAGNDLDLTGSQFDLESTLDIVSTINLAGTGTINGLDAIDATTESTLEAAIDALSNLTTVGTLTSGSTGTGFTLDFANSTLSGNIGGGNIDESSLAGLTTSNFTSANISQWTNNSGYITASSTNTLTNKSGNISQWTNDSGYITDGNTGWDNSYNFITASSSDALTNKTGNISMWTNDSGYLTSVANGNLSNDTVDLTKIADSLTFDANLTLVSDSSTNDYKLVIDNASTGDVAELFEITTTGVGGTVATAIDLSDADIATAIAIGANDIVVGGVTIESTEFARLDGKNAGLVDTDDAVSTAITGTGTLTAGSTGAGFTLNFGTSTLSGNIGGGNIDESSLAGLTTSNFTSANISQWTNNAGYITDGNTGWDNSYNFITASSSDALTNKTGNISMWTNDSGYLTATFGGTVDANGNIITNIGSTGTDFDTTGALAIQLDGSDTDGALSVDNAANASPIFVAEDNGTPVFTIADGGIVTATANINADGGFDVDDTFVVANGGGVSGLSISDTDVPLTGASFTFDFNNAADRTFSITNSSSGLAFLSVEGDVTVSGGDIIGANSDSIDVGEAADATFTFTRNNAGVVTITSADDNADAALTVAAGGTGALTLGDSNSTTAITSSDWAIDATGAITGVSFDANGTGNSISNIETADIANQTLDADDLDQATADGTPNDEECLTFETSGGGDFEWQTCSSGGGISTIQANDVDAVTTAATIDFLGSDFDVAAAGSEGDISIDYTNSGIARKNQSETVINDWTFSFAEGEDLAINLAVSGTNAGTGETITLTNTSASGNQYGLVVDNAASSGTTEALVVLDNSDNDTAVTAAIQVINAGGGFTNLFDIAGTGISVPEFTILDSGIALSELTDSGTLTATTVDINGGNIDGTTIGGTTRAAASVTDLNSNGLSTLGDGSGADNITFNPGSGTVTFTGFNNCSALETNGSGQLVCGTDDTGAGGGASNWTLNNGTLRPNNNTADVLIGGDSTSSAKFAFMNLNSNSGQDPLASFAGNLRIGARPNVSNALTKVTQTEPGQIASGGTTLIASVSASAVYNGSLYIGTGRGSATIGGAEVYRYDDGNSPNWTRVSHSVPGTMNNGATQDIASVSAMAVFNGKLFIGTSKTNAGEVYRYDGGTTWTRVNHPSTAGTIGSDTSVDGISSMAVMGGRLYAGTDEPSAAGVYRYDGSATWTKVSAAGGGLTATNQRIWRISSMATYNNSLYVGTKHGATGAIYKYGGAAVTTWVAASATNGTVCTSGSTLVPEISALTVYAGKLYLGTSKPAAAEVCKYEDTAGSVPTNWNRVVNNAGTIRSGGTTAIEGIRSMTAYNGRLYIGTEKANSGELYEYIDGDMWIARSNAAGQLVSSGTSSIDKVNTLVPYNDYLFVGTGDNSPSTTTAAEVYSYRNVTDQSYALKFQAASQYTGINNGLINEGAISFMASSSANAQGTGAFIFTHGIQTRNGAYDVAEDYPTRDDSLEPGDLVSIDTAEAEYVKKSERAYDSTVIGVFSENPALRLSQVDPSIDGARTIPVALAGRVPVKVSSENGPIKPGDFLTASSKPGVAMKATKSGLVFGQAMSEFSGEGIGKVTVYIKSATYQGEIASIVADFEVESSTEQEAANQKAPELLSNDGTSQLTGLQVDGAATVAGQLTAEKLRVKDSLLVESIAHIVDTLTSARLIVNDIATFFGKVIFKNDVDVQGKLTLGEDTVGVAVVKKGKDQVEITFNKAYEEKPIITVSLIVDENEDELEHLLLTSELKYIITQRSKTGFIIKLNKPVEQDIRFSWTAVQSSKLDTAERGTVLSNEKQFVTPTIMVTATPIEPTVVVPISIEPTPEAL